ncbi:RNA-binding protein [Plasmodium gonderi]|uniref:RNA-binding protein n=1 Tax=Plasmodium gonderi TaxID=77519 RepID=A0A1Y1JDP3_PLAGO|nr:RNA-binding protein [Plasmodium gonderi]GAW80629.1 RNA-binding protein [Plasmodium gonderi]
MGIYDKIRNIENLNEAELKNIGNSDASWHDQYKESSYIYIGNLDKRLTEGDIVIVFSQFGEPIDVNLVHDKETGKSKGYCFLSYEDQRSTVLAVDNFNGYKLLDKPLVVDHILNYRIPQKYANADKENEYKPSGAEGQGIGVYNVIESEINLTKAFEKIKNKYNEEKKKELLDEDELWAQNFEKSLKKKSNDHRKEREDRISISFPVVEDRKHGCSGENYRLQKKHKYVDKEKYDNVSHARVKHLSHHTKGEDIRKNKKRINYSDSQESGSSRGYNKRGHSAYKRERKNRR